MTLIVTPPVEASLPEIIRGGAPGLVPSLLMLTVCL
jgi:hypothetical protein